MRRIAIALLLIWSSAAAEAGEASSQAGSVDCAKAIAAAERAGDIPGGLLAAIGHVESGRRDPVSGAVVSWPWTIDAGGAGHFFATKAEAVAATQELQAQGIASIDVGCMQVNLAYHPDAFATLEQAFDPLTNALYAARFLRVLFSQNGDWPAAVAAYHSQTREVGAAYQGKVLAIWTPTGPLWPPAHDSRHPRFAVPDWIGDAGRDRHRSPAIEGVLPLPKGAAPAAAPAWVERVISAIQGCSAAPAAEPAPGDAPPQGASLWKTAASRCSSSPFAKPAVLRQLLGQR